MDNLSQNAFFGITHDSCIINDLIIIVGFAGIVTAVAAWSIWGGEMFPATDPTGGKFSHGFCRYI